MVFMKTTSENPDEMLRLVASNFGLQMPYLYALLDISNYLRAM